MKTLFIFVLFFTFYHQAFSQFWKEPFDTLFTIDKYERIDANIGAKSYMMKKFVIVDEVDEWEYKEFDQRGRIAKSSASEGDTTYYFYNDHDVCQEVVYPGQERLFTERYHIFDDNNRLNSIVVVKGKDTIRTHYIHENGLLMQISFGGGDMTVFQYDSIGRLIRKKYLLDYVPEQFFDYSYGEVNELEYRYCYYLMFGQNRNLTCEKASAQFNSEGQIIQIGVEIDSPTQFFSTLYFTYNVHGKIELTFGLEQGKEDKPYQIKYFYNEDQLLTRTEYYLGGEMYMHYDFEWGYYE